MAAGALTTGAVEEVGKHAVPFTVTGSLLAGVSLPDIVCTVTLVYYIILIVIKWPQLMARFRKDKHGRE